MPVLKREMFASSAGHWYTPDGDPAYEVLGNNGTLRATTLRDARKHGWVPSVTSILKVAAKPGLEIWKQTQLIQAALTLPRWVDETDDDFAVRAVRDANEQARKAREKGSELHAAIEWHFSNGQVPAEFKPAVNEIEVQLSLLGLTAPWKAERSFASPLGYGGKIDLHNEVAVVDFKTKGDWKKGDKLHYPEHGMQLAAYAHGLGNPRLRRINVYVSTDEPGKVEVFEWPDTDTHWRMFLHLLEYWKLANNYLL